LIGCAFHLGLVVESVRVEVVCERLCECEQSSIIESQLINILDKTRQYQESTGRLRIQAPPSSSLKLSTRWQGKETRARASVNEARFRFHRGSTRRRILQRDKVD